MSIKKSKIKINLLDDFGDIEKIAEPLKKYPDYHEQSKEEIIEKMSEEEGGAVDKNTKESIEKALSVSIFIEMEDGRIVITSSFIVMNLDKKLEGIENLIKERLNELGVKYEENVIHSLEIDNLTELLESNLKSVLGDYTTDIVIEGEKGNIEIMANDKIIVEGKKPILDDLVEVVQDEQN